MQKFSSGPIFIIIASLLWAVDGILRRSLYHLPPTSIIFLEHLIGFLILYPFVKKGLQNIKLTKKDFGLIVIVALFSGLIGTLLFTSALQAVNFIPFSVVFLMQKLQPIFAILFAWILLREVPSKKYIPYAVLALVSAYFVTFPLGQVNLSSGDGTIIAALLALGAAVAWGGSTAFSKKILTTIPVASATALRFLFTLIFAGILLLIMGKGNSVSNLGTTDFLMLLMIALSSGMVALFIYYKGLKRTPVRVVTILELTFPLVAVFIDIFLYKTTLHITQYISAVVLLFAMYQITKTPKEKNEIQIDNN